MTIPAVRRGTCLVSAAQAVRATEPLTRLIASSVADRVLSDLSAAISPVRVDSELAMINAFAEHDDLDVEISPTLCAVLLRAREAARISGGLVDPVVGTVLQHNESYSQPGEPYSFDADLARLSLSRGTVLDLWAIGCAWAAEEIVSLVISEDPAASLAVVVGPAVVAVGAAWEISESLESDLTVLDAPLRCGLRSFAVLSHARQSPSEVAEELPIQDELPNSQGATMGPWWDRAVVGAEDAVQALTFGLMAERLGDGVFNHILHAGGQAEFVGPHSGAPLRRRVRTPGWLPGNG